MSSLAGAWWLAFNEGETSDGNPALELRVESNELVYFSWLITLEQAGDLADILEDFIAQHTQPQKGADYAALDT